MANPKRQSPHKANDRIRSAPRLTSDDDAPFGSPVHALHETLSQRVAGSPNIHASPAARILYFVVAPAVLWAMIIGAVKIF